MKKNEIKKSGDHAGLPTKDITDVLDLTDASLAADSESNNGKLNAPKEYGGRKGLDPTRYGDWEKNGRCIDF